MKELIKLFTLCFLFLACNRPDSSPELRDPIYLDLKARLESFEREEHHVLREMASTDNFLDQTSIQTNDFHAAIKIQRDSNKSLERARQQIVFTKMAIESRKRQARIDYLKYYKEGRADEWPDPNEYARFKSNADNNDMFKIKD